MTISDGMRTPAPSIEVAAALAVADAPENSIIRSHSKNTPDLSSNTPSGWRERVGKKLNPFSERNLIPNNGESDTIEQKTVNKKDVEKDVILSRKYEVKDLTILRKGFHD
jgi:hypothetical protein